MLFERYYDETLAQASYLVGCEATREAIVVDPNRDIQAFKSHLSLGDTLYTVVQNGHAFKTPAEIIAIHEDWFKDPNWTWNGTVVRKIVGEDMAMALVRYQYQPNKETAPFETWLIYVFQLQEGSWRIVHDQNTALDYHAFARAAGLEK